MDTTTNTTTDQFLTTRAATVILPQGGHHMVNGGKTVCGFDYDDEAHYDSNILRQERRLSCLYCARQTIHPLNEVSR